MDECNSASGGLALSIFFPFLSSIVGVIILNKLTEKSSRLFRWLGIESESSSSNQDIIEIKKATLQIAQEWIKMTEMITNMRDEQTNFVNDLQSELEARNQSFCKNITVSMEEEFLRNDNRFSKMKRTIETMQEDIQCMKNSLQKLVRISTAEPSEEKKTRKVTVIDTWVQTEYEIKKRTREGHSKSGTTNENEASKLVTVVKKCLGDLMKDAKLHLSIDREEENRELQIIFSKLEEDRAEIKKTIIQAFSIAAEQAKKNFAQFEHIGQDAMRYIAVLNENTNKMLKLKLEETDGRLKEIFETLNRQIFDVVAIREILENIDGQFDDIFQRVELACQRNTEHCDEMAQSLEKVSNDWTGTVSELGEMAKDFTSDTKKMKNMLNEMKNIICTATQKNGDTNRTVFPENDNMMQYDSVASTATQDLVKLSQKHRNLIFMYSMIQSCWEKLSCMNDRVENGCGEICQLVQMLAEKLQSLNQSVEKFDEFIKGINTENFDGKILCVKCHDMSSEKIESTIRVNMLDAGDCQPQIYNGTRTALTDETLAQKMQNAIAIDKEVKMIELILRKVCEKQRNNSLANTEANQQAQNGITVGPEESRSKNAEGAPKSVYQMVMEDDVNQEGEMKMQT